MLIWLPWTNLTAVVSLHNISMPICPPAVALVLWGAHLRKEPSETVPLAGGDQTLLLFLETAHPILNPHPLVLFSGLPALIVVTADIAAYRR